MVHLIAPDDPGKVHMTCTGVWVHIWRLGRVNTFMFYLDCLVWEHIIVVVAAELI